jgi:hypothetical protein
MSPTAICFASRAVGLADPAGDTNRSSGPLKVEVVVVGKLRDRRGPSAIDADEPAVEHRAPIIFVTTENTAVGECSIELARRTLHPDSPHDTTQPRFSAYGMRRATIRASATSDDADVSPLVVSTATDTLLPCLLM